MAATVMLFAVASLCVLHPLSPVFPQAGLDASWVTAMGEKAGEHARWGVDLAFTYGPASPLVTTYYNPQYLRLTLPLLLGIGLVQALCFVRVLGNTLNQAVAHPSWPLLGLASYAFVLVWLRQNPDAFFLALPFLVFILDIGRVRSRPADGLVALLGAAAVGTTGLAKMSFALAALPLFLLADLSALARRRVPVLLAGFAGAFCVAYVGYGQSLADLPSFIRLQGEVIAGYSEAMSSPGPSAETAAFLAGAGALLALLATAEVLADAPRRAPIVVPAGLALFLLVAFKAGFVRHDLHSLIAWLALACAALIVAIARLRGPMPVAAFATTAAALAIAGILVPALDAWTAPQPLGEAIAERYRTLFWRNPGDELGRIRTAVRDGRGFLDELDERKQAAWDGIRQQFPLPRLEGTVDIVPSDQSVVIASGNEYRPRPSFQEYSTYTSALIDANRNFLQGGDGPRWILFGTEPGLDRLAIDNRYPAFAEGGSWPDMLRFYKPARRVDRFVGLERRAAPLTPLLSARRKVTARFNQEIAVGGTGPVFATVDVGVNWLGRIAAALFRPPLLSVSVRLADGRSETFRFVPSLGRGGFVLSPLVRNATEFTALALGRLDALAANVVLSFRIEASPTSQKFFSPRIEVELASIETDRLSPPPGEATSDDLLGAGRAWRELADVSDGPREDKRVPANAPRRILLPALGLRRLRVGYGMFDDSWGTGQPQGVCFAIAPGGGGTALWSRCLDPLAVESDRGEHSAAVDIPAGLSEIALETRCPKSCDWGWSYWSRLDAR